MRSSLTAARKDEQGQRARQNRRWSRAFPPRRDCGSSQETGIMALRRSKGSRPEAHCLCVFGERKTADIAWPAVCCRSTEWSGTWHSSFSRKRWKLFGPGRMQQAFPTVIGGKKLRPRGWHRTRSGRCPQVLKRPGQRMLKALTESYCSRVLNILAPKAKKKEGTCLRPPSACYLRSVVAWLPGHHQGRLRNTRIRPDECRWFCRASPHPACTSAPGGTQRISARPGGTWRT